MQKYLYYGLNTRRHAVAEGGQSPYAGKRILIVGMARSGVAAAFLLSVSLMGQARMVDLNEETAAVTGQVAVLQTEQTALRVRSQETLLFSYGPETPGELSGDHRSDGPEAPRTESAAVLSIRRGQKMNHFWRTFIDTLGASFH